MRTTRALIAFILALVSGASAALPHRHALAPSDAQLASTLSAPENSDATRGHETPCGACARQQGFGLAPAMGHAAAPRAQTALPVSDPAIAERSGQGPNVTLRGPPSATSAC